MIEHTGVKPYIWNQCEKTFLDNNDLKVHMKIHTGERSYQCSQCDKPFSDNAI